MTNAAEKTNPTPASEQTTAKAAPAKTAPAKAAAADTPKAAAPKQTQPADGPRPGTRARKIFDMLIAKGGATAAEMKDAGLGSVSIAIYAEPFAEKYGYQVEVTSEGRVRRYALIRAKKAA
jgi:hypothetical protein